MSLSGRFNPRGGAPGNSLEHIHLQSFGPCLRHDPRLLAAMGGASDKSRHHIFLHNFWQSSILQILFAMVVPFGPPCGNMLFHQQMADWLFGCLIILLVGVSVCYEMDSWVGGGVIYHLLYVSPSFCSPFAGNNIQPRVRSILIATPCCGHPFFQLWASFC